MTSSMLNRRNFLTLGTGMATLMAHGTSWGSDPAVKKYCRKAKALGTDVKITVLHRDEEIAMNGIDTALGKIEHIEQLMSLYRPDSQLSLLNRKGVLLNPHPDLVTVLRKAMVVSKLTDGAFDVTVQPLWNLYTRHAQSGSLPSEHEIAKVRRRIGWEHVRIEEDIIFFDRPGMQVTLNGVAQGMAADFARQALEEGGIEDALIDAGEFNAIVLPEKRILGKSLSNTPGRRVILPKLDCRVAVFPLPGITVKNIRVIIVIIIYLIPVPLFLPPNYQQYQYQPQRPSKPMPFPPDCLFWVLNKQKKW